MIIKTVFDFNKALESGPYAWPGGYPLYFITADGAALSWKAAIEDIHYTYNHAGDLVKLRYVCSHIFMGQKVMDYDVAQVTIQKALNVY